MYARSRESLRSRSRILNRLLTTAFDFSGAEAPPSLTITRSGTTATTLSSGAWVAAAANTARFDAQGLLIERQKVNKINHQNFAPTAATGISVISGDAVASVVSDPTGDLANATIDGKTFTDLQNGNVIQVTCTTASVLQISDTAGNTNPHSWRVCIAAAANGYNGTLRQSDGSGQQNINPALANKFYELTAENYSPNASARYLQINLSAGKTIYIIGAQYEEDTRLTSPIINPNDGAASTRNYDEVYFDNIDTAAWWNQSNGAIVWLGNQYGLLNEVEQGYFGANEGNGANNQIVMRMISTDEFSECNYKVGGSDQLLDKIGKHLSDDTYMCGVVFRDGYLQPFHGHGLNFLKDTSFTKQTETLTKLRLGREQQYYGYADCSIEKLVVLKGNVTLKDVAKAVLSSNNTAIPFEGQSNAAYHSKNQSVSPYTNAGEVAALAEMANYYSAGRNAIANGAVGGAGLYYRNNVNNYFLENDGITHGPVLVNAIEQIEALVAAGVNIPGIFWRQGSTDVNAETYTTMYDGTLAVVTALRNAAGGNVPVVLGYPARRSDAGTFDNQYTTRWIEVYTDLAANVAWIHLAPNTRVHPLLDETGVSDGVHISDAGFQQDAIYIVRKIADLDGQSVTGPVDGSTISNVTRSTTTVTVTLTHPTGITDFTPTSGIEGFRFFHGETGDMTDTEITINAAVRTNATTITLTLDSAPTGSIEKLYYCCGTGFEISDPANLVVGNDTNTMPLQIYDGVL